MYKHVPAGGRQVAAAVLREMENIQKLAMPVFGPYKKSCFFLCAGPTVFPNIVNKNLGKYSAELRPAVTALLAPLPNLPRSLATSAASLLGASLTIGSWKKYECGWKAFDDFEKFSMTRFEWPLSREAVIGFTTWCLQVKKLQPSSAETYLSALAQAHKLKGLPRPASLEAGFACIKGATNLQAAAPPRQVPSRRVISMPLLRVLGHRLAHSPTHQVDAQSIWTACLIAFYTSARMGELLAAATSGFDPSSTLKWGDIKFREDGSAIILVNLPKSGKAEFLDVFPFTEHGCCPMAALNRHKHLQREAGLAEIGGPVFRLKGGKNLTLNFLNKQLKTLLVGLIDPSKDLISCHSFRAGVASTLNRFPHLANSEDIKGWGRWDSDCYTRYARLNVEKKKAIFQKIAVALSGQTPPPPSQKQSRQV